MKRNRIEEITGKIDLPVARVYGIDVEDMTREELISCLNLAERSRMATSKEHMRQLGFIGSLRPKTPTVRSIFPWLR